MMIVTVCPTEYTVEETLFTLQFAIRIKNISLGAIKRVNAPSAGAGSSTASSGGNVAIKNL